MIRAITLLHLRRVRRHPLRAAIAVVALASGVALSAAVSVVQTSTSRSFDEYARSLAGPAPLRVVGPIDRGGLLESSVERIRSTDGVDAAVPLIQAVTLADGASERDVPIVAIGYDCSITAVVGDFFCDPSAIAAATTYRPPLVSPSLAERLGPDGILRTNDGPKPLRGAQPVEALEQINNGRIVALPIHVAQGLFTRPERVDVVYVLPGNDTEVVTLKSRIREAVGPHTHVLAADEPSPQLGFMSQLFVLLGLVGVGTLATGGVLAHNAIALSLEERRRDLAVASAIGAKPRTIMGGALLEGAVLGLVGGMTGAAAGVGVAFPVLASFQFLTERMAGLTMSLHITHVPFVVGAVLGVLLGMVAAIRPARRASRLDVVAEIQGRVVEDRGSQTSLRRPVIVLTLGLFGLVLTRIAARGGALEPWQPLVAQPAALLTVGAFMSAVGQFSPLVLSLGARLARRSRAATRMAWANLVGEGWRSASMVLAAGAAIAAAFMISNMGRMVIDGVADATGAEIQGIAVGTTPLNNSFALDAKPSPDIVRRIQTFPGVERVRRSVYLQVATPTGIMGAQAVGESMPGFEVLRGRADPQAFARGEVLIGPGLARRERLKPGDELQVPGLQGFTTVHVQGIVADGDNTGLTVSMPLSLLERIWGQHPPGALNVDPSPGVGDTALARRIEAAGLDPNLFAFDRAELIEHNKIENARFFAPFWALQRALVVIAFAAVLSNLLLVALRRKRELGLVAAVGMPPIQMGRMVVMEAVAIGLVAVVLGTVFALGSTEAFRHALNINIPYPMPFRIDPVAPLVYGAIMIAVLIAAALWPAWRTSRLNVVDALRYE